MKLHEQVKTLFGEQSSNGWLTAPVNPQREGGALEPTSVKHALGVILIYMGWLATQGGVKELCLEHFLDGIKLGAWIHFMMNTRCVQYSTMKGYLDNIIKVLNALAEMNLQPLRSQEMMDLMGQLRSTSRQFNKHGKQVTGHKKMTQAKHIIDVNATQDPEKMATLIGPLK